MGKTKTNIWQALAVPGVILFIFALAILGIIFIRGRFLYEPKFTTTLSEISTTTKETSTISGKTNPKAKLEINGKVVKIDKGGNFSYVLALNPGQNRVAFTQNNGPGSKTIKTERIIVREMKVSTGTATLQTGQPNYRGNLSNSGPKENFAILFITLLFISLIYYYKSHASLKKPGYKLFT